MKGSNTMNTHALTVIAAKVTLGSTMALGLLLTPHASADDVDTIDIADIHNIDSMPLCGQEDGSDVPVDQLPCIWGNDGNAWLTFSDHSLLIVDRTDGNVSDEDLGA